MKLARVRGFRNFRKFFEISKVFKEAPKRDLLEDLKITSRSGLEPGPES